MKARIFISADTVEQQYWRDLWSFRELLYFLAWRDVTVRYKQTVIGVAWALVRPLLTVVVFTVVFEKIAGLSSNRGPYPVMVAAAILPWQFFSSALAESSNSLLNNANLLSKVYFPRLILPASAVITSLVDFGITFVFTLLMMMASGVGISVRVLTLPLLTLLAFALALGAGLWLSALNVRYRDFRYVLPFVIQFGLYISPVGFDSSSVPAAWRGLFLCNPMVGVIDGFRWALLGSAQPMLGISLLCSVLCAAALCFGGILYFRSTERTLADVI